MAKLPEDFTDLLIELGTAKAEYLLVGGWAVILYGHVRATDDMDLFDRLLAAQALERGFTIVSIDEAVDQYGVIRLW